MSEWVQKEYMFSDKPICELDLGVIRCEIEKAGQKKYQCFVFSAERVYMFATCQMLEKAKDRAETELRRRLTSALLKLDKIEAKDNE